MTDMNNTKPAAKRSRKMAREAKPEAPGAQLPADQPRATTASAPVPRPQTKTAQVLELLQRPGGATIDQLVETTDWLPHTTRAALTGLKKKGHVVTSEKLDGVRVYRVPRNASVPAEAGA